MSYQIVYTSALHLLDTPTSGYGVVARTKDMPKALLQKVTELSRFREDPHLSITGAQYSYQIVEHQGARYHVLTTVDEAGTDYSGRTCHLAHHLVLTPDEVAVMKHNASRPTPAGVIIALAKADFWIRRWEGVPKELQGEPRLSASCLPDASRQTVWKELTGHKSNARAFFTRPYEAECLCLMPPATASSDILLLLHESDWLSASRGWGRTFTTHGADYDSYKKTQRIFSTAGSLLERQAERANRAILSIDKSLLIHAPEPEEADSNANGPQSPRQTASHSTTSNVVSPISILTASPYRYCEADDADTFEMPPKKLNWLRVSALLFGFTILGTGIMLLQMGLLPHSLSTGDLPISLPDDPARPSDANHDEDKYSIPNIIHRLDQLARAPYEPAAVRLQLDQLEAHAMQVTQPDSQLAAFLQDCIRILKEADQISSGFAPELERLAHFAHSNHMDAEALCRLYMHEATVARAADEHWFSTLEQEYVSWEKFLLTNPGMINWLRSEFGTYLAPVLDRYAYRSNRTHHDQVNVSEASDAGDHTDYHQPTEEAYSGDTPPYDSKDPALTGEPAPPDEIGTLESSSAPEFTLSRIPMALVEGHSSARLQSMLHRAAMQPINKGELILVADLQKAQPPQRILLGKEYAAMRVTHHAHGDHDYYTVRLLHHDGTEDPHFLASFVFVAGQLQAFSSNQRRCDLISLPLPDDEQQLKPCFFIRDIVLSMGFTWKGPHPPVLHLEDYKLSASRSRKGAFYFDLKPKRPELSPPPLGLAHIRLQPSQKQQQYYLPRLNQECHFFPAEAEETTNIPYQLRFHANMENSDFICYLPEVTARVDFSNRLHHQLRQLSSQYPMGKDQYFPMGKLFYLAQEFMAGRNAKSSPQGLANMYLDLLHSYETHDIAPFFNHNFPDEAYSPSASANEIIRMMRTTHVPSILAQRIEKLVFLKLENFYKGITQDQAAHQPDVTITMHLSDVRVIDGNLHWYFTLTTPTPQL